jgi:hypothetical protein
MIAIAGVQAIRSTYVPTTVRQDSNLQTHPCQTVSSGKVTIESQNFSIDRTLFHHSAGRSSSFAATMIVVEYFMRPLSPLRGSCCFGHTRWCDGSPQ